MMSLHPQAITTAVVLDCKVVHSRRQKGYTPLSNVMLQVPQTRGSSACICQVLHCLQQRLGDRRP